MGFFKGKHVSTHLISQFPRKSQKYPKVPLTYEKIGTNITACLFILGFNHRILIRYFNIWCGVYGMTESFENTLYNVKKSS